MSGERRSPAFPRIPGATTPLIVNRSAECYALCFSPLSQFYISSQVIDNTEHREGNQSRPRPLRLTRDRRIHHSYVKREAFVLRNRKTVALKQSKRKNKSTLSRKKMIAREKTYNGLTHT